MSSLERWASRGVGWMAVLVLTSLVFIATVTGRAEGEESGGMSMATEWAGSAPKVLAAYALRAGEMREPAPRGDGYLHLDTPRLISRLKELGIDTYFYLVWRSPVDWDDLKDEFLPAAREAGINVVVYLVPPSESTGELKSYPYTTDYIAWAKAIAELSLRYPNLIAWAIDDFDGNLSYFTPEYMATMAKTARNINPRLGFLPLLYATAVTQQFLSTRGAFIDGVIVAYRDDPYRNTQRLSSMQGQIDRISALLNQYGLPLYWMIYASQLSRTPAPPSVKYVEKAVSLALDNMRMGKIDGIVMYQLPLEQISEPSPAITGRGYLSFFIPPNTVTRQGDVLSASQTICPNENWPGNYTLMFYTRDVGPNTGGYHVKQLLVDDTVVWESDVAATASTDWQLVTVNLTPYLAGKSRARLTFRLYEKKGVSNYWQIVGFDCLVAQGFTLVNPDFEDAVGWELTDERAFGIAEIAWVDPQREAKVAEMVAGAFSSYRASLSAASPISGQ